LFPHRRLPILWDMICLLTDRAVLEVTGEDRVTFLQGLVSNDVTLAAPGRAVWAALLTPQGKWLADFFIHSDGQRLLLDVEADQAAMLAQKLTRYRLRAKVAVGPATGSVHAGWDEPMAPGAVPDPRLAKAGWRLLAAAPRAGTAGTGAYNLHRLGLGLPGGSQDMEAGKTTLLEAGFAELNGVSWTKGCYMGQELTARTKYRGLLKRRLVPVDVVGPLPARGTPVTHEGIDVGDIRSLASDASGGLGLALLRIDQMAATALQCGDATLVPHVPAWMPVDAD
jgi:folate-binding protein YgfZ